MADLSQKSTASTSSTSTQMQVLLNEFKSLYQNRLKKLEKQDPTNEETVKFKIKTLESYVKDLLEQNEVLVQTIDELEREANGRVSTLETRLQKSSASLKEANSKLKEQERELRSLVSANESLEREFRDKNDNFRIIQNEFDRLKISYEEAVRTLACKTAYETESSTGSSNSNTPRIDPIQVKQLEENLDIALKAKAKYYDEIKEKDKKIAELQAQIHELNYEIKYIRSDSRETSNKHKSSKFKEDARDDLKQRFTNLNYDVSCLITAINNAGKTGKIELKNAAFKEISSERFNFLTINDEPKRVHFAEDYNQNNVNDSSGNNVDELKTELKRKEDLIIQLEADLKTVKHKHDVSISKSTQTRDTSVPVATTAAAAASAIVTDLNKDQSLEIRSLKNEIIESKTKIEYLNDEISFKKREIKDYLHEQKELVKEINALRGELLERDKNIFDLKEKLHEQNLELSNSSDTVQRLHSEVHNLKTKNPFEDEEPMDRESHIEELMYDLNECKRQNRKLLDEINQLNLKFRNCFTSNQDGFQLIKNELKLRDDTIHKLRQEILLLQEKRDQAFIENNKLAENIKTTQKETQREVNCVRKSYEEELAKCQSLETKCKIHEQTLQNLKDQYLECQNQSKKLNTTILNLQASIRDLKDQHSVEIIHKNEDLVKTKDELRKIQSMYDSDIKQKDSVIDYLNKDIHNRILKIDEQAQRIDKLNTEIVLARKRCEELDNNVQVYSNKLSENDVCATQQVTALTAKLMDKEETLAQLQAECTRRLTAIQQLENDLSMFQKRHDSAIEEIGRLESRIQNQQIDFKNANDLLNCEIRKRDDHIHKLRLDKDALKQQIESVELKLKENTSHVDNIKVQISIHQNEIRSREERIMHLEKQLDDNKFKFKLNEEEMQRLDKQIKAQFAEINTMNDVRDDLDKRLNDLDDEIKQKDEIIERLTASKRTSEEKFDDIKTKMNQKDDVLQRAAAELERVKPILQTKTKECQEKSENIIKLSESLKACEKELSETKANLLNERDQMSIRINSLENNLNTIQSQYSQALDSVKSSKAETETLRAENASLTKRVQADVEDKRCLLDKIDQLDNQLVSTTEKHKACQNEVAQRDHALMKTQTDLNLMQEKFGGSLEQLKILNSEIERLNVRIKQQMGDLREYHMRIDRQDEQLKKQDQLLKQYEYENEVNKQEISNNDKIVQNMKAEWTANIRNHEEEIKSFKYHVNILNEELSNLKVELSDAQTKITDYKQQLAKVTDSFDFVTEENQSNLQKISKYESLCCDQETKILNYSTEIGALQHQLESAGLQMQHLNGKLIENEQKYEQLQRQYDKSEATVRHMNEVAMELKFKVADKEQTVERLNVELSNSNQNIASKTNDIKKLNDTIMDQSGKIGILQDEYDDVKKLLSLSEASLKDLQTKLNEKTEQYQKLDERYNQLCYDFKTYETKYQYTSEDIAHYEHNVTRLGYQMEDITNQLQSSKLQFQDLTNINKNMKEDIEKLSDQKRCLEKELLESEQAILDVQRNLANAEQKYKKEVTNLEATAKTLHSKLEQSERQISQLNNQLTNQNMNHSEQLKRYEQSVESLTKDVQEKTSDITKYKDTIEAFKVANTEFSKVNAEKDAIIANLQVDNDHMRGEVMDSRQQYQICLQEKANIEERFMLINKNLEQIQEEIRQKVTDYVRLEQICHKQNTEIKTLRERTKSYEDELYELKNFIEKLKKDLFTSKEENTLLQQETTKHKNNFFKIQHDLESKKQLEKGLSDQIAQNEILLQQTQEDLRNERARHQEYQRVIGNLKQTNGDLENTKELSEKIIKDLNTRLKDKEAKLATQQQDIDGLQNKIREIREEYAEKDGQLKVLSMNLASSEKQRGHLSNEIEKYDETIVQYKISNDKLQQQFRDTNCSLIHADQQIHDLKMKLATFESTQKETLNSLQDKSKEVAILKSEINSFKNSNKKLKDQIEELEERIKYMKTEVKKKQEHQEQSKQQSKAYEDTIATLQIEKKNLEEKFKKFIEELSMREEQLVVFKVELQSYQDKLKIKTEECSRTEIELQNVKHKYQNLSDEARKLETMLSQSRENSERLHKESELVISNVNNWVGEQRNNSEKLAIKIREQATAIIQINNEKQRLIQENEIYQQQIRKLSHELQSSHSDKDKIDAVQALQQDMLEQLQNRLKEYEMQRSIATRSCTPKSEPQDDTQNRMKLKMESIQLLGDQINHLQHENLIQKETLEREICLRKALQMKLEEQHHQQQHVFKQNANMNIELAKRNGLRPKQKDSHEDIGYASASQQSFRVPLKEKNQFSSESTETAESVFWKQKVGELTNQLQETNNFWNNRIEKMQNHIIEKLDDQSN